MSLISKFNGTMHVSRLLGDAGLRPAGDWRSLRLLPLPLGLVVENVGHLFDDVSLEVDDKLRIAVPGLRKRRDSGYRVVLAVAVRRLANDRRSPDSCSNDAVQDVPV